MAVAAAAAAAAAAVVVIVVVDDDDDNYCCCYAVFCHTSSICFHIYSFDDRYSFFIRNIRIFSLLISF